jgi:hypothetical protein
MDNIEKMAEGWKYPLEKWLELRLRVLIEQRDIFKLDSENYNFTGHHRESAKETFSLLAVQVSELELLKKHVDFSALRRPGAVWVRVEDRLPTGEDADTYNEVLTIQIGRHRPTFMKFWEIKDCPFTKKWMTIRDENIFAESSPSLPTVEECMEEAIRLLIHPKYTTVKMTDDNRLRQFATFCQTPKK